jgi:hypothetical protein
MNNDNSNQQQQQQHHSLQNIDIFNLNEDINSQQKYYYYYETNEQQQQQQQNYNPNDLFFTTTNTTNLNDDDSCNKEMLNKLVIKYDWLKFKSNLLLLNDDLKTSKYNNPYQQQQQQQQQTDNFDYIILNCSYCCIYYNCDKFLIQKFEQFLQDNSENTNSINNINYLLNQFLNQHEQTNEHKIACASTYLTSSNDSSSSSLSTPPPTLINQQSDNNTIVLANLDSTPHTLTPQSSPSSSSFSELSQQQQQQQTKSYLLLNKSPTQTSLNSSSTNASSCFKDEEIESCLNTHELVVNDNFILETLANNDANSYYNNSTVPQQQQQQFKNSKKHLNKHSNNSDIQQYGSILKAINKRKLHISCPLCISKVVNMSDHLVKKHNIKDRYQRKHLMDSVRRNYLANTPVVEASSSSSSTASSITSSLNEFNQNKRISPSNSTNSFIRQNSTPIKTRKLIKCPICSDDNKYFVNISDHLIKIHHLNTSEQRKPILKTIKSWSKLNDSSSQQYSINYDNNSSFSMIVDQQQQQQNIDTTTTTTSSIAVSNDDILIISSNSDNNNNNNEDDEEMNEDNDYLLNDRFEEETVQQEKQQQIVLQEQSVRVEEEEEEEDVNLNHKYQQIKKNDLRRSILKRYTKQIRKVKSNNLLNSSRNNLDKKSKTVTQEQDQSSLNNLLKLENNVNLMNVQLNSIIELSENQQQQNVVNNQYYSNSSIMIFEDRNKQNDEININNISLEKNNEESKVIFKIFFFQIKQLISIFIQELFKQSFKN